MMRPFVMDEQGKSWSNHRKHKNIQISFHLNNETLLDRSDKQQREKVGLLSRWTVGRLSFATVSLVQPPILSGERCEAAGGDLKADCHQQKHGSVPHEISLEYPVV